MIIDTKRLKLRPLDKKDINSYFNISQGEGIERYTSTLYVESKEKAKRKIENFKEIPNRPNDFLFAIEEKANKVLIGVISATEINENTVDICLFIAEACRNKGYGKEAVNSLLKKFAEMDKQYVIEFFVEDDNSPAIMLMRNIKAEAEKRGLKIKSKKFLSQATDYFLKL